MARKGFTLSAAIRGIVAKNKGIAFNDVWTKLTAEHKGLNIGTARVSYYKLRGGKRRMVKRAKPGRKGSGHNGLADALTFIRACGSIEAAQAQLKAERQLLAVARES
jgi:hypothetical protein